ncbi:MAG: hypothetical protein QGF74_00790 [Candidatus Nanoarchaeia archaeon]|jgi:hypothetical protein|nr:hypothetical protein [Candidatus Nanoarchaeia archaeon]|tara:strand:+ start:21467 stop:21901 length:435 start_codon:yes stop_codon:yes gene_type:complete
MAIITEGSIDREKLLECVLLGTSKIISYKPIYMTDLGARVDLTNKQSVASAAHQRAVSIARTATRSFPDFNILTIDQLLFGLGKGRRGISVNYNPETGVEADIILAGYANSDEGDYHPILNIRFFNDTNQELMKDFMQHVEDRL